MTLFTIPSVESDQSENELQARLENSSSLPMNFFLSANRKAIQADKEQRKRPRMGAEAQDVGNRVPRVAGQFKPGA